MLVAALPEHAFWITSRAAGVAALILSSAAVGAGLLMGGTLLKRRPGELRATHEALSLATLIALAVHALALLGDGYLKPSAADISIPFVSDYHRIWMAAGVTGGWLLAILGLSYYARARIGVERWRRLHRFTALAWVLGLFHALGMGTDAGAAWFLGAAGMLSLPAFGLLAVRLSGPAAPAAARR